MNVVSISCNNILFVFKWLLTALVVRVCVQERVHALYMHAHITLVPSTSDFLFSLSEVSLSLPLSLPLPSLPLSPPSLPPLSPLSPSLSLSIASLAAPSPPRLDPTPNQSLSLPPPPPTLSLAELAGGDLVWSGCAKPHPLQSSVSTEKNLSWPSNSCWNSILSASWTWRHVTEVCRLGENRTFVGDFHPVVATDSDTVPNFLRTHNQALRAQSYRKKHAIPLGSAGQAHKF